MTTPTIHLNGSSAERLMAGYEQACDKLQEALLAMGQCSPHGRDYYPQGPDAISAASKEHQARMDKLRAMYDEMTQLWSAVDAQVTG